MSNAQMALVACSLVSCLITNVLWYRAKFLVRAHGYPMSYFRHWQDLRHLRLLIESENDPVERQRFIRLRRFIIGFFVATFGFFGAFLALH